MSSLENKAVATYRCVNASYKCRGYWRAVSPSLPVSSRSRREIETKYVHHFRRPWRGGEAGTESDKSPVMKMSQTKVFALLLTSCVTVDKGLNFSKPRFLHL